jgi:hypothetical protein
VDLAVVLLVCFLFVCATEPLWGPWKLGSVHLTRRERAEADKAIDGTEERRQTVANERPAASHGLSPRQKAEDMSSDVAYAGRAVKARPAPGETMAETAAHLEIDVWPLDERD